MALSMSMGQEQSELQIMQQQLASVYTERNICVGIIAQMALDKGWNVGYLPKETEDQEYRSLIVDFPEDQICWEINDDDWTNIPFFKALPEYSGRLGEAPCTTLSDPTNLPKLA